MNNSLPLSAPVTRENGHRLNVRLIRKEMKKHIQYRDKAWFALREMLAYEYSHLPAKEQAFSYFPSI